MHFMRFEQGRARALTFSYDDGVQQDQELAEILTQAGMKGTFNLNSGKYAEEGTVFEPGKIQRRMTEKEFTNFFSNSPHEVACHALTHTFLTQLPPEMASYEIVQDKKNLETRFSKIIRGFAYPYGDFNDSVVKTLELAGIAYARTVISTEDFRIPTDWLRLTTTCRHTHPRLMEFAEHFLTDNIKRAPYLFSIWGHSYEFEQDNNWSVIENLVNYLKGHEDEIWYATNIEICDYVRDYSRLVTSSDGTIFHNPTSRDLWFFRAPEVYCIKSGETLKLK